MGRKKIDRSNKLMQSFEITKPLKIRLEEEAELREMTISALIRMLLEQYFENKH